MNILLSALRVWPGNPRKTLSEEALAELATSIRDQGVLQPVVVRALASPLGAVTHEVIDGQRRFLASQRADLRELPVVVRDLDDEQALELALAANTARAEAEPLEEAEALEALVKSGRSPIKLAERLGRSPHWVAQRRKLLGLCEEARAFARAKNLSFAHMLALAVVDAAVQRDVMTQFAETSLFPPAWQFARQVSFRLRKIENAPFDPTDATLGGEGACAKCVYRSDTQGDLFGDTAENAACLRGECWNTKTEANWERTKTDAKKRKLKVLGDHKEVFSYGEILRDDSLYAVEVPEGSTLPPVAIARAASGKPVPLYDATAAKSAWDAWDTARTKSKHTEEDESEDATPSPSKPRTTDSPSEDRARRRAISKERLLRLAKVLEEVDGLERLALAILSDDCSNVDPSVEVLEAAGIPPALGAAGLDTNNALAALVLTLAWDRLRDEEYTDGTEIEQWIAGVLGEALPAKSLAAQLTASIEESKSTRDLEEAWRCISSTDPPLEGEVLAELTATWRAKADRVGLSTATLKKMAAEGKAPQPEKKLTKRSKKSSAEASP